jgi:hypothetical protein
MAGSSSTGFSTGSFMQKVKDWYNDPSNTNNPLKTVLECLPNSNYTNAEFIAIKAELVQIQSESFLFESKRIYNEATNLLNQIDALECVGKDATFLFSGFIEYSKQFINYYNSLTDIVYESDVNQNPNYYNN